MRVKGWNQQKQIHMCRESMFVNNVKVSTEHVHSPSNVVSNACDELYVLCTYHLPAEMMLARCSKRSKLFFGQQWNGAVV